MAAHINDLDESARLRWLLDRIPGICMIETDRDGIFTHFGPGAEAFFACPAEEALGKLHYRTFHDAEELRACQGSAEFRAAMESPGWTEEIWRVIPRTGEPFPARVTLLRRDCDPETGESAGWIALYRRIEG